MEESRSAQGNSTAVVIGVVVVLVVAVVAVMYRNAKQEEMPAEQQMQATSTTDAIQPNGAMTGFVATTTPSTMPGTTEETTGAMAPGSRTTIVYKDGKYEADGEYNTPSGQEHIGVTVTLKNDVITDATFEERAKSPTSKRFQGMFESGYKALVIGKKITDVKLDKVSGSSLTPKGFHDALDQIKATAQS